MGSSASESSQQRLHELCSNKARAEREDKVSTSIRLTPPNTS